MARLRLRIPRPPVDGPRTAFSLTLQDASEWCIRRIQERTAVGISATGEAFAAYSPAYAKRRQKQGLGLTPDLKVSGQLLDSLALVRARAQGFTISVTGTHFPGAGTGLQSLVAAALAATLRRSSNNTRPKKGRPRSQGDHTVAMDAIARGLSQLRPFIGLTADDRRELVQVVSRLVRERLQA